MTGINFLNLPEELRFGTEIILKKYNFEISEFRLSVSVKKGDVLKVSVSDGNAEINYDSKNSFFRQLGILLENIKNDNYEKIEKRYFDHSGVMLDVSRNGVMKIQSVKKYIEYMAVMGLDTLYLYMEDVYEVKDEPYFGYMRGRYTIDELKECDDYADMFGIEIIPCIQTLGHMEQFLRWDISFDLTDTDNTLIADYERTYDLLDRMIQSVSQAVRTKRIHIGMDEASGSGLGMYLTKHGYKDRMDIYLRHINRVVDITKKYGLKPMIWSDMFFKFSSETHAYYDKNIKFTKENIDKIPEGLQLVYWDYYHADKNTYRTFAKMHKDIDNASVFAGGIWLWAGLLPDYHFTMLSTQTAMEGIKEAGLRECFATVWEDDGCETNQFFSLLGLQLYAEHTYNDEISYEMLKERYKFCTGMNSDFMMLVSDLHYKKDEELSKVNDDTRITHWIRKYLWQDILTGLADYELIKNPMSEYYAEKNKELESYAENLSSEDKRFYNYVVQLGQVLELKCLIAENLQIEYKNNNLKYLRECAENLLPQLKGNVNELRKYHEQLWFDDYKAFGWEVLSLRYAGLIQRIDDACIRINKYLNGEISGIEELEEERLPFIAKGSNTYKQISKTTVSIHL